MRSPFLRHALGLAAGAVLAACGKPADTRPVIGLVTKTDNNPFFVKMREGAEQAATAGGARLVAAAGRNDGDNAGQVTAIENLVAAGAKAILISPSDAKAIVPAVRKAREAGVLVIAVDSPTDPVEAADALFAAPAHPYTQALLREAPSLSRRREFEPIAGEIPSPLTPPAGCHFHPRCPFAVERCRSERPALRPHPGDPGHVLACHRAGDAGRVAADMRADGG